MELERIAGFLLPVVLPVFGLVLLGRMIVRVGLVDANGTRALTDVVFWFLLPAMLFVSVGASPLPSILSTVALYFGVAVPLFLLSVMLGRRYIGLTLPQAGVFGLNAVYGNTVLMGIPIVGAVWGSPGLGVLLSIVAAHSIILLPLAIVLVEFGEGRSRGGLRRAVIGSVLGSIKNPVVASILLAAVWRSLGWPLAAPLRRFLELLAQAAPALSLICLGASLPVLGRTSLGPAVLVASVVKLAVMPLAMAAIVHAAGVPAPASVIMIVTAAMPTGANAFLLARRSESLTEASAATVVITTLVAVLTLSVVLGALAE